MSNRDRWTRSQNVQTSKLQRAPEALQGEPITTLGFETKSLWDFPHIRLDHKLAD
jgi:hypothetical protein